MIVHSKGGKDQIFKFLDTIFPGLIPINKNDNALFNRVVQNQLVDKIKYSILLCIDENNEIFDKSLFGSIINGLNFLGIPYSFISVDSMKKALKILDEKYSKITNFYNYNCDIRDVSKIYRTGIEDYLNYFENIKNSMMDLDKYNDLSNFVEKSYEIVVDIINYPNNVYTYDDLEKTLDDLRKEIYKINSEISDEKSKNSDEYYEWILDSEYNETKGDLPHVAAFKFLSYIDSGITYGMKRFLKNTVDGEYDDLLLFDSHKSLEISNKESFTEFYQYLISKVKALIEILLDMQDDKKETDDNRINNYYYQLIDYSIEKLNEYLINNKALGKYLRKVQGE